MNEKYHNLEFDRISITNSNYQALISLKCKKCNKFPIPPYRISKEITGYYCKICLNSFNDSKTNFIEPSITDVIFINSLHVKCKNYELGCDQEILLIDLDIHEKKCNKEIKGTIECIQKTKEIQLNSVENNLCKNCFSYFINRSKHNCILNVKNSLDSNCNQLNQRVENLEKKVLYMESIIQIQKEENCELHKKLKEFSLFFHKYCKNNNNLNLTILDKKLEEKETYFKQISENLLKDNNFQITTIYDQINDLRQQINTINEYAITNKENARISNISKISNDNKCHIDNSSINKSKGSIDSNDFKKSKAYLDDNFKNLPQYLEFKEILTEKITNKSLLDGVFCIFEDKNNETLLAFPSIHYTIDIIRFKGKKVISLKGHMNDINFVRQYFYTENNSNLLISGSMDTTVKIWYYHDKESYCMKSIKLSNMYNYYICSAIITGSEKTKVPFIVTSSWSNEKMKVLDINGNLIKEFGGLENKTFFINSYIEDEDIYIINCNTANVQLYNLLDGNLINTYQGKIKCDHFSAFITKINDKNVLVESDILELLRIWEMKTAVCLKLIAVGVPLRGITKWNDNFILAAGNDGYVKVIDIINGKVINSINTQINNPLTTIVKFNHVYNGESLLVAGGNKIILMISNNKCLII